ncbi:MAG TPA: RHS repeat-associated core domain-containing protein [Terriglobales bacterium]|nr:RHS repeat-associated core domain-containing protein [Terriglobales bacterium]
MIQELEETPLPGGATLYETPSTKQFLHKDWLGSVRFSSTVVNRASVFDRAFAPYGEVYDTVQGGITVPPNFTGDTQDTVSGTYDTPNRELNPNQGRWLTPDPAGVSVVDPSNPQSWNSMPTLSTIP